MRKFYDAQQGAGGFSAQTLADSFIPSVNSNSQNVQDLYDQLISACRAAADKYSACDFGGSVSANYSAIAEGLSQAKSEFSSQIASANTQVTSYVENTHVTEQKQVQYSDATAQEIQTIRSKDYSGMVASMGMGMSARMGSSIAGVGSDFIGHADIIDQQKLYGPPPTISEPVKPIMPTQIIDQQRLYGPPPTISEPVKPIMPTQMIDQQRLYGPPPTIPEPVTPSQPIQIEPPVAPLYGPPPSMPQLQPAPAKPADQGV